MKIFIAALIAIIIIALFAGNIMSQVEQPDYLVVTSKENIEIRNYPPLLVAEVEVSGERKEAIRKGFKILADFIFGNNKLSQKMVMTAPVTNQLSEKIAMTAPVMQESDQNGEVNKWKIRFVMPKKYTIESLPKPNVKEIHLIELPAKRFAVIQFSGLSDDKNIEMHKKQLEAYVSQERLKPVGGILMAFYNPPWTLPLLRRNEVMIQIEK